jgi:subtilisin family serine protease
MPPTCPNLYVKAPAVERYGFGLFSVAIMPAPEADPHWRCGVEYEPYACDQARVEGDRCATPQPDKEVDDGVPLVTGSPFTVYDGYLCRLPGRPSEAEIHDRATQALELGEQRAVEEVFWTGTAGNTPHLADPSAVVLNATPTPTAADALNIVAGVAALETYLGAHYSGVGILHMPRGAATLLSREGVIFRERTALRTLLGTGVAAGGGYAVNVGPDGTEAPDGTAWIYATGAVVIRRGEIIINPDTVAAALNRATNEVEILAERQYVITSECVLAAVLVSISCA